MRAIEYKEALTRIEDVDEKGQVVIYPAVMGIKDKGLDTITGGAFTKTISENFANIMHYKNHDQTLMPGVVIELTETKQYLRSVSNLILKTQLGLETYEEYKAMAASGKTMKHSIGYNTIKQMPDPQGGRFLKEIFLAEISTLTKIPMNDFAGTESVKSFDQLNFNDLLTEERFYKNLLNSRFTDAKLEQLEGLHNHIKSLITERAANSTLESSKPIDVISAAKKVVFKL